MHARGNHDAEKTRMRQTRATIATTRSRSSCPVFVDRLTARRHNPGSEHQRISPAIVHSENATRTAQRYSPSGRTFRVEKGTRDRRVHIIRRMACQSIVMPTMLFMWYTVHIDEEREALRSLQANHELHNDRFTAGPHSVVADIERDLRPNIPWSSVRIEEHVSTRELSDLSD
jgi:hypothetical protein